MFDIVQQEIDAGDYDGHTLTKDAKRVIENTVQDILDRVPDREVERIDDVKEHIIVGLLGGVVFDGTFGDPDSEAFRDALEGEMITLIDAGNHVHINAHRGR